MDTRTKFQPTNLYSEVAKSGTPPYFYKQPESVKYDFDQGTPDQRTFPLADLKRLAAAVLDEDGPGSLDYCRRMDYVDLVLGYSGLREEVNAFIQRRDGRAPGLDGLQIMSGSVQGIALAINAYVSRGDAVFVEAASFPFALKYFDMVGAKIIGVPMDGDGMVVEAMEKLIVAAQKAGHRPKMIYTIPTHQLPTGSVLSLERRKLLLELAARHDMIIIEDNMYQPFGEAAKMPTLWALDRDGRVLHSDSFAKTLAPAARVGWMAGTPEALMPLAMVRQDLGVSTWLQRIMQRYLKEGLHEKHIARVNPIYAAKREAANRALEKYCAPWISFTPPKGAWYYWLRLSDKLDWNKVQADCMSAGIAMRPGEMFIGETAGAHHMRLAVAHKTPDEIDAGLKVLGDVLKAAAR